MARKFELDVSALFKISRNAKKNSETFLAEAKEFAAKQKFARAYAFLVFALEEAAKQNICNMYDLWLTELKASKNAGRNPEGPEISEKKVKEMFSSHASKRITVLTQLIFALTNTFDLEKRTRIIQAIHNSDPKNDVELQDLIRVFNKMYKLREMALYIEIDGTGPDKITEADYLELKKYTDIIINGLSSTFTLFKHEQYEKTEEKVRKLLENNELASKNKPVENEQSDKLRTYITVDIPVKSAAN